MYKYENIEDTRPGDILECVETCKWRTKGKLYIATGECNEISYTDDYGSTGVLINPFNFKLIKTKPGTEAKAGDSVIFTSTNIKKLIRGGIYTVQKMSKCNKFIYWNPNNNTHNRYASKFKVLCKADSTDEFTYPMWFEAIDNGHIVKFDGLRSGTTIKQGNSAAEVGFKSTNFIKHTDKHWKQIDQPIIDKTEPKLIDEYPIVDYTHSINAMIEQLSSATDVPPSQLKSAEHQPTQQTKENIMNEQITITMTAKEFAKHEKSKLPKKGKSDLQLEYKKPFSAKVFNEDGKYKSKLFTKSQSKLEDKINEHLHRNRFDIIVDSTTHKTYKSARTKVTVTN